jgi:hypothetical protein
MSRRLLPLALLLLQISAWSEVFDVRVDPSPAPIEITVAVGDAVNLHFGVAGIAFATNNCGLLVPPWLVVPGQTCFYRFPAAGIYELEIRRRGGVVARGIARVVRVSFPVTIAAEVGFHRSVTVLTEPVGAAVEFSSADPARMEVAASAAGDGMYDVAVTPRIRGTTALLATILKPTGPAVIASRDVTGFVFDASAATHTLRHADDPTVPARIIIRPFAEEVLVTMRMFAHHGTFPGGATELTTSTDTWQRQCDIDTDEVIGVLDYEIELPLSESMYCHTLESSQVERYEEEPAASGAPVAAAITGATKPTSVTVGINGHSCTCVLEAPDCVCTLETIQITITLSGDSPEPWMVHLVQCRDPDGAGGDAPRFGGATGSRIAGPIFCDEQPHSFSVYTGGICGTFAVFLVDSGGNCFECGSFTVFERAGSRKDLKRGFTCGAGGGSPYPGFPITGGDIPGGTGGDLLYTVADGCGRSISLWCHDHEFKMMTVSGGGASIGQIAQCIYNGGRNRWSYWMSECEGRRMLVKVKCINIQPDLFLTRRYRVYTYDACANRLHIYHHSTTSTKDVNVIDYPDLEEPANPGGQSSDIPPMGTNDDPPGDNTP